MHAVILAGGQGTRLRPLTETRPKPLLPFCGAPFAAGLLRRLRGAGATSATFLVGADPAPFAPLEPLGAALGIPVAIATEAQPLDTAGACRDLLRTAEDLALVCNGDILTDLDYAALVEAHRAAGASATLALTHVEDTSSFGVIEIDADGRVERFTEKPAPGTTQADTINAGTYVLSPGVFDAFDNDGPLSFERTVFPGLVAANKHVLGVATDDFWLDLGTPDRYLAGTAAVLQGRCGWPLDESYERVDTTVLVHPSAQLQGSIGPNVVIGAGVVVGYGAQISDSVVFDGVTIGPGATIETSILAERTAVGARAVLKERVTAAEEAVDPA